MPKTIDREQLRNELIAWLGGDEDELTADEIDELVTAAAEINDRIPADFPQERDDALWQALVAIEARR